MRFSLLKLLVLTTAVAVYAAAVFALPWGIGLLVLASVLLITPALFVGGVLYSRGCWRPFWIGCGASGIGPTIIGYLLLTAVLFDISWSDLFDQGDGDQRLFLGVLAFCQLSPIAGGLVALTMHRIHERSRSIMPPSTNAD
ncbi:hypothetical protein [Aeoliella sp. SH292]|uniref:hypothetical protein n=1 Tax=Aeoliella sp. SH292 TaxID=3454464 RepID=UPI003F9D78B6